LHELRKLLLHELRKLLLHEPLKLLLHEPLKPTLTTQQQDFTTVSFSGQRVKPRLTAVISKGDV
jgi:hypothetical protein